MGFAAAALTVAPGLARAQPVDLFYERTVMTAAQQRCDLFAPEVAAALASAAAQARGAALRAGTTASTLRQVESSAQAKAASVGCASPDIAVAADRVKSAFAGFAKVERLVYPGDILSWRADRGSGRTNRWKLAQDVAFGPDRMAFGLAGRENPGTLIAVARFADGAAPYAARLMLRDEDRSGRPYLNRWGGGATTNLPLDRRLPPAGALKTFAAAARSPAGQDLLPKDIATGWAFRFPDAAAQALAGLDPRESIAVEFLFAGDVTRRAYVEVGDFAAGRAFLQLAQR
jgi:hypothetical protein